MLAPGKDNEGTTRIFFFCRKQNVQGMKPLKYSQNVGSKQK
jgi:hypothetical protein